MNTASVRTWRTAAALPLLAFVLLAGPAAAQQKVLTLEDYDRWHRIGSVALSADGRWMSYAYTPNDGDAKLFLQELDGARVDTVPRGGSVTFSDDGRWALYAVAPPRSERARGRGGRGQTPPEQPPRGRGGRGGAAGPRTIVVRDLETRATFEVPRVSDAAFSPDGRHVLFKRARAEGAEHEGTDLLVRTLATGETRIIIGNVGSYAFNENGTLLVYAVDAADNAGNGLYLFEMRTGLVRALDSSPEEYAQLAWNEQGTAVAALRGVKKDGSAQRDNVLLAYTGLDRAGAAREVLVDPARTAGFPSGMVISDLASLTWSANGQRLFLGIKQQETEPPESDSAKANVDVWHWKDEDAQSVQIVRLNQARRATQPAVYHLESGTFVRLGDDELEAVTRTARGDGRYAIGRMDGPYAHEVTWGGSRADYYRVDVVSGERSLMMAGIGRAYGASPDGRWWLYLQDGKLFAREIDSGRTSNLSEIAGVSFIDHRDDHPYELPIYGLAGWSKDGRSVLLYDDFDVWSVPLEGGRAVNLTGGVGATEQIRFRIVRAFDADEDEDDASDAIDLTKPIRLSAYGEWTKKSGYYELRPGAEPAPLVFEDASIGSVARAADADRIIFTRQTFVDFPDYWVSDTRFRSPRRVTDANPQQAEFSWGRRILIDYTNSKGQKLQGTLALPANYEPGRRYPMIVYFYEIMSNQHHRYSMPTYDDRPHMSTYASDGYLVLQPDVVYEAGRPGSSALDCVTSAVQKVIDLGYADPERIGLQGHSWGGYQSSFIVTQTDMFAAVVTGAPVTNLMSFYNELYKSSGNVQQGIVERGQVRMGTTPYQDRELFMSQSPVHQAEKITTPFLILHGTEDGSVDWHQGLEYFNAARRLGKDVILLSYPGEGHHLGRKENQIDFQIRMKQYFDHHLKGAPPAKWITDGVRQLDKGRETDVVLRTARGGER